MIKEFILETMEEFQPYHEKKRLTYEDALILMALIKFHDVTGETTYLKFVDDYLNKHVDASGNIRNYQLEEYNIDNILAGNALLDTYFRTQREKYLKAAHLLRKQLATHPRTDSGSFWHKLRYPYQIWLDGLYMGQLFYLCYGVHFHEQDTIQDVFNQFLNVRKYLFDSRRKLYYHAYDEKKQMQWADPQTGRSPNVWSRSVGWLAMALVECGELLSAVDKEKKNRLKDMLQELLEGMLEHRDPLTKMWFQIVDKPQVENNYPETSGSAMLAYAMLKGSRIGLLDREYGDLGLETLKGIESTYLTRQAGKFYLAGTCKVAGLDNERRDGSEKYYLSEPVVTNEIKGLGPYFFCYSEILK